MPGGLLQLTSYGNATAYLHEDPQVTFFKQVWRRSTPFAMESIQMPFSGGQPNFGVKVTAPIAKGPDLAHRAWLQITLPDLADYSTTAMTATSSQPLIARAYIEGSYVRLRLIKPVATPPSGTWKWFRVKIVGGGYVPTTELEHNTLVEVGSGAYTDFSISKTNWPAPWSSVVSITATAVDQTYANESSDSMARTITNIKWCNNIGHALLESIEWEIGGARIDRVPNPEYFDVWSELTEKEEKRAGYNSMVGKFADYDIWDETKSTRGAKTYFVPLPFSFCTSPSQSIPMVALMYHEVRINITFRDVLDLVRANVPVTQLIATTGQPIQMTECTLWADMIYLDVEERRRMSTMEHEQLITQIQYLGDYTISPSDPGLVRKVPLDGLNHPVKELIWVYQGFTRYQRNAVTGNDLFNYQLATDSTEDAFQNVRLTLNGSERMPPRSGQYFRQVQPYQHHTRVPTKHVLCYNFGLDPESKNPTGSCNFSRLEQASLQVTLSPNIDPNGGKIKVYALGYNLLRYAQGLAGLAFPSG
jgi:hypothetical protein